MEGTVFRYYDFKIMPDFGQGKTVLQDAYLDAKYFTLAQLMIGKYKVPFGIERLQSARDLEWVQPLGSIRDQGASRRPRRRQRRVQGRLCEPLLVGPQRHRTWSRLQLVSEHQC